MKQVILTGRAGQDPEMKYFESGKVKTTFSIASNHWDSSTKSEVTDWINIECWGKTAEIAGEYIKKGKVITVQGELIQNTYTTEEGKEKTKWVVVANKINFEKGFYIALQGTVEKVEIS